MTVTTHKADPTYDEDRVRHSVQWSKRYNYTVNGLYLDEELAGPDGVSIQLFVTEDTPQEVIDEAARQIQGQRDVVHLTALVCPKEWLS